MLHYREAALSDLNWIVDVCNSTVPKKTVNLPSLKLFTALGFGEWGFLLRIALLENEKKTSGFWKNFGEVSCERSILSGD